MDARDGDDRTDQLQFQAAEVDLAHPVGPVLAVARIDLRDEVLIARKDHHQKQVARKHEVDQREHAQDHLGLAHLKHRGRKQDQFLRELDKQDGQREHEPDIERGHDPAAPEHAFFKILVERHGVPVLCCSAITGRYLADAGWRRNRTGEVRLDPEHA